MALRLNWHIAKLGAPLTETEEKAMRLIVDDGLVRKQMPEALGCRATVSRILNQVRIKLGAKTFEQACAFYERRRKGEA